MSKTLIGVVVVGLLIVGGYLAFKNKGENNTPITDTEINNEQTIETSGKKMAFSEFIKQGGSYKCEVKEAMSDFENSGTVYISGGNMRGDTSTTAEGRTMETSFIMKDGYIYNWSPTAPNAVGVKMKVPASTEVNANAEIDDTYGWRADQVGDYNCEVWIADESKFTIPTNITFKQIGA